jgi:glycosyltransferase involved in cell wall biosynthesis
LEHALVAELEKQLIAHSDLLLATSQTLYRKLANYGKEVHLFSHGVDIENFSREAGEHACLQGIPAPRVGYFGLFDERSDQELIAQVARAMPDVAFVITGPTAVSAMALATLPNIHFTGPVPYEDLPAVIGGLKALLIPYKLNAFTETISPLKLKEYLVTGRPVVSTPLGEAKVLGDWVTLAATADEWVRAIRRAFDVNLERRKSLVMQAMLGEAWNKKAEQFVSHCLEKAGNGRVTEGAR